MILTLMPNSPTYIRGNQHGFSLLEAMVALLILSVGLLGLAALQARAMQYTHDSLVRSQATAIANEIMDKIRSRAYDRTGGDAENTIESYVTTAATAADCPADIATATAVVAEKGCWLKSIQSYLPDGSGLASTITRSAGADNGDPTDDAYQISIQWRDRQTNQVVNQRFAFQP